jgi:hypothetical protein
MARHPSPAWIRDVLLAVCTFVVFAALLPPWSPQPFVDGLDSSWNAALAVALTRGLAFGRDIVFTYGPLGFLSTQGYWPGLLGSSIALKLLLALAIAVVAPVMVRRMGWAIFLLPAVPFLVLARDAIVVCMAAALAVVYDDRPMSRAAAVFFGIVFGVFAASKFTYLMVGVIVFALMGAADPAERGGARRLLLPVMLVSFALAWLAAGQSLDGIPDFVARSVELARGYGSAMQIPGPASHVAIVATTIAAPLAAAAVGLFAGHARSGGGSRLPPLLLLVTLLVIHFYVWKHAVTRADGHVLIVVAFGFVSSALAMAIARDARRARHLGALAASRALVAVGFGSSSLAALVLVPPFLHAPVPAVLGSVTNQAWANATSLLAPSTIETRLRAQWASQFEAIRETWPLPDLRGTVDVVTWDINRVLAAGLDWSPRPVIQSYAAYTPALAALNAGHYDGDQGPRYVAIDLKAIDGRLPLLEDPLLWPVLLRRYRPAYFEPMLVVERRAAPVEEAGMSGEVPPAPAAGYVRARIAYAPSVWERVKAVLFRPDPLAIVVRLASGETRRYRYIPGAGDAGFVVSPLVEDTFDLLGLYCGCEAFGARKQVQVIALETMAGAPLPAESFAIAFEEVVLSGGDAGRQGVWAPATLRLTAVAGRAPIGEVALMEKGRLVRNAHAPSQFELAQPGAGPLCFGIREGAWGRPEFEGVTFTVAARGPDGGEEPWFAETLHPVVGTVRTPSACREVPEALRGRTLVLTTTPVRTPAYNWAYWQVR